jgi:hypothetical protein
MIRKSFRILFRLGLLAGLGMALFKFVQGRRSFDDGRPSTDWAPPPAPAAVNPNLPRTPPDPPLVQPVVLEVIIEKKKAAVPVAPEPAPAPAAGESVVKKAPAKKKAAAKKVADPPAAGPVKKAAPKKAAAAKKAPAAEKAPAAKKAAPAKKAAKKQPPQ